ncbi:Spo0E family sporulation regulatory protein-aspartic acid phosphatase [Clostridium beijerinckii]|uniref:Spo0E family sporulation regulatory protein-aspartic acid phosphatase n=1 Tax=Clostridium beijerinckii TaxID=1520 RepID=UPI001EEEF867|nr:Spo0E family sporulation regulatory protein-aspartic acid phosphatase [Clostridium beijerinckii]
MVTYPTGLSDEIIKEFLNILINKGELIMESINKIDSEIYKMEQNLLNVIKEKVDLFDPEVIVASEQLDSILDEYSHLIQLS